MRTNGFILIVLSLSAAAWAGSAGYLPSVGPVALRFETEKPGGYVEPLPPPPVSKEPESTPVTRDEVAVEIPTENPQTMETSGLMHNPITVPGAGTNAQQMLIGPIMDNGEMNPQVFLRFFTPSANGTSRETILMPAPGFNPAFPPTRSSTATYQQTK